MRYTKVNIAAFGYELAPNVVTSEDLEDRLGPLYQKLHVQPGQLESLTGIFERRYWDPGFPMYQGASLAGKKALAAAGMAGTDVDMLIYAGVCRDNLEPATACAVAHTLGLGEQSQIYDLSNACLGVVNGMIQVANAIELGQIRTGLVVSCESARQIVDTTIDRILAAGDMETFKTSLATLTGGSGAVAVVLTADDTMSAPRRLRGAEVRSATAHHRLCRWGPDTKTPAPTDLVMETDAVGVLKHGVALGTKTYEAFRQTMAWPKTAPDKIICHQVGSAHQRTILQSLGIAPKKDFTTFAYLGNIGTVSLPITAAIAEERGFLQTGDRVGFFGIGSGLNCLMLGVDW
ncbi:MAG: 3-oxoacyl-ACP synthase III [Desulfobacterales bacterium]|nr:3-oxoacyl-ACP synthase III [Desulfobacterales bacterium]